MKRISIKNLLLQLKKDLIGKDSYRGVTLTYAWLANQFGHFSLGFIPSILLYFALQKYTNLTMPAFWSALIVSSFWLLFELYNFLGPLLLKKSSALVSIVDKQYTFTPAWRNIAFDTFTDLCFFWLGSFAACLLFEPQTGIIIIFLLLFLIILYPSYYWYKTKIYLQNALYPFQFRLSQWNSKISEDNKQAALKFLKAEGMGNHLIIFGSENSGKSSLSIGIGTEISINHHSSLYTTAIKLFSSLNETDKNIRTATDSLWTWRETDLLIIDDINPGGDFRDIIKPDFFLELLSATRQNARIKSKNVIWVLGNQEADKSMELKWRDFFRRLRIPDEKIYAIDLTVKNNLL